MAEIFRSDFEHVDINKPLSRKNVGTLIATGDSMANRFGANVFRAGEPVSLDGCAVTGYFMRPNMETVVLNGVASGNTAYVDLKQACYAQQGTYSLAIKVIGNGITHTLRIIDGYIRLTQTDTLIDPGEVVPTLDELLAQIAAMEAATEAATTAANNAKEFIVTVTQPAYILDGDTSGITADKTFAEITAAINAGKTPVVRLKTQGKIEVDTLHLYKSAPISIVFRQQVKHTADYNIVSALQCIFNMAGGISVDSVNFRAVPDGGTDGQVLVHKGESTYEWRDPNEIADIAPAIIPTATGSIVTITDGAARPAADVISHIEPVQSGNGEPSPENIRPISGWDSAAVQRTGKNWFSGAEEITFVTRSAYMKLDCPLAPGTYTVSALVTSTDTDATGCWMGFMNANEDGTIAYALVGRNTRSAATITLSRPVSEVFLNASTTYTASEGDTATWKQVQIELGTTATEYEPYQGGQSISATLPETVYGGKLNWTTGVLTNRYARIVFDGTTDGRKFNSSDSDGGTSAYISKRYLPAEGKPGSLAYSNIANSVRIATAGPIVIGLPTSLTGASASDNSTTVTSKFNAACAALYAAGTPLEIVYEIATPEEIQLSPYQLSTLHGINNVWSNCGSTDLSYIADTKLYIDQRISALLNA